MMETMIKQNGLSFNDLEKEIFKEICDLGRKIIYEYLENEQIDELLAFLRMYRDSITEDEWIKKAGELLEYFTNNKDGLLPYQ